MNNTIINYCRQSQQVATKKINNENLCFFTFFGQGGRQQQEVVRHARVMEYQQKIFTRFNIPMNYVENDFNYFDFGQALDGFANATKNVVDYWIHFDIDAIPLRPDIVEEIYEKIKDKKTIWGCASQSNHIFVNGTKQHAYCNTSTFALSTEFYKKLGQPSFRNTNRGDMGEELTWKAQELGYTICLVYPRHFDGMTEEESKTYQVAPYSDLDNGFKFGMGTTYSDMVYHATMQIVPRSTDLFVAKCESLLNQYSENSIF